MPVHLSRFVIRGLHRQQTINMPIEDNILILVGDNGIGKSTVATFMYFFLTRQWHRMLNYNFYSVSAIIHSEIIDIKKEDLEKTQQAERILGSIAAPMRADLLHFITGHTEGSLQTRREIFQYACQPGLPASLALETVEYTEHFPLLEKLEQAKVSLERLIEDRILYLPASRRVEQDLAFIVPEGAASSELKTSMERWKPAQRSLSREPGQCGIHDAIDTIKSTMKELAESWRADLRTVIGTYLRDLLQEASRYTEADEIIALDEGSLNAMFHGIDHSVLPKPERERLREIIAKIKVEHSIQTDDRVVAHVLTRLIELQKTRQQRERAIREFVEICNKYLTGKELVYDTLSFEISIRQLTGLHTGEQGLAAGKLDMSMLSSGEQHIVSLFSHLYLAGNARSFVIIDEPELSLSVFWQERFLPDILQTGRCSGLVAVTHSPFIFANQLDIYAHSFEQFLEPVHAVH